MHYLQSHSSKKTQTKSMKAKKISINIQETIHRKSTHTSLKIFDFEKKRCSKLHFAEAQPQLVFNLFLTFDKFDKCPFSINRLRVFFQCKIFCL